MQQPIYSNIQICPKCESDNTYPFLNMLGSTRHCNNCKNVFKPQITGYKKVITEKDSF